MDKSENKPRYQLLHGLRTLTHRKADERVYLLAVDNPSWTKKAIRSAATKIYRLLQRRGMKIESGNTQRKRITMSNLNEYESRRAMLAEFYAFCRGADKASRRADNATKRALRSLAILNESNLTGGEYIGGDALSGGGAVANEETSGANSEVSAPAADDDGGDGDSDPDRRRKQRKGKTHKAPATPPTTPALPAEGYVRLPQIIGNPKATPPIPAVIPVSKSSWWNGIKSGKYPQPVKLGQRTTAWRVSDIRALIQAA